MKSVRVSWILYGLSILGISSPAHGQKSPPDITAIIKAGERTRERLDKEGCSWQVVINFDIGARLEVQTLHQGETQSTTIRESDGKETNELYRIIDRDGLQYVRQFGRPLGKFRPHEAPLCSPLCQLGLELAEPLFATGPGLADAKYEGTSEDIATYRIKLSADSAGEVQHMIEGSEYALKRGATKTHHAPDPNVLAKLALLKDTLANGMPMEVNVQLGIIHRVGSSRGWTATYEHLEFKNPLPESFRVDDVEWKDFSDDPTNVTDLNDLVMVGNFGLWQQGKPAGESEGRLVNVRTGNFRRIPFEGTQCIPACFLKARTSAAVLGLQYLSGAMLGLFEVNLKTGANRRLGGTLLENRLCLGAALSPDGKTLAAITSNGNLTAINEICLIDLATDQARMIGESFTTTISWFPDGKQLLVGNSVDRGAGKKPHLIICRMSLQGELTTIGDGDDPLLLCDGKTILFQGTDGHWHTCDLMGQSVKPYAEGMPPAKHPSPCPDGRRIIWICNENGASVPRIGNIGSADLSAIPTIQGFWDRPQWR